jgi:glycosyltransferase involved in cell wall biosynthesis
MGESVEFWSSVQYGTFLKGLVRELGTDGGALGANADCGSRNADREEGGTSDGQLLSSGGNRSSGSGLLTSRSSLLATFSACQRFAVSESDYRQARGALARLRMRWRCYIAYPNLLHRRIRREEPPQALVVCTNTFYAPWVAMRSARKTGVPVVHWMFDLFPDVLILAGKLRSGSLGERWLRRWVRAMFDGAAANVFLGERLLAYAERQFGPIPRSTVIPVGCDAAPFAERRPAARADSGPLRLLYCGNFGRMHDVETLIAALHEGMPQGLRLDFCGNGAGFQRLAAAVDELGLGETVLLRGNLPEVEWLETMAAADVALVTMKRGAEGIVMPSKTYSAMAAGQAILAVCPRESDLADTVARHDCGWVIEPGDAVGLRTLLESLPLLGEEVLRKRRNAWRAAQEVYDQRVLAKRWRELLAGMSAAGANK